MNLIGLGTPEVAVSPILQPTASEQTIVKSVLLSEALQTSYTVSFEVTDDFLLSDTAHHV